MSSTVKITIHSSQFPENVRRDLLASLRTRRVNHKFHYDSVNQTQKWLALHQACSPTRNDADCQAIYTKGFKAATAQIRSQRVHVIGLGCGGGQKDTRLLKRLQLGGKEISYTPCDASTAMVQVARRTALAVLSEKRCFPFVCDLATMGDLWDIPVTHHTSLVTFFGMIPNFEPQAIMPKLASRIGPKDFLLFSANLAPGTDYAVGMKRILPQYDNDLTRDWLMAFLVNLGMGGRDGHLRFAIEDGRLGLKRVVARFHFNRPHRLEIEGERFAFRRGEDIRLFFSYRYTPELVHGILTRYQLKICQHWVTRSEEEGVFLVRRL
jgi:L-histidine N-alpha-methyltransferase